MSARKRAELVRAIGRWDLVALVINGVVGAGIFGLPSKVHALVGSYSLLTFFVCAAVIGLIVLCLAEVAGRFHETGGPYLCAREAFGSFVGFETGWLLWMERLAGAAAIVALLIQYLTYFSPVFGGGLGRMAIIIGVFIAVIVIRLIGVRETAIVGNVFTVGKLAPLLIFVGCGIFYIEPRNIDFSMRPDFGAFSAAILTLGFAFVGFETPIIVAGETKSPQRDIPFALCVGIGATVVLYALIQLTCIGTLPELSNSEKPLADAARRFLGERGATLIAVGAVVSMLGTLNAALLAASRLPFAMAENNQLPNVIATVHPRFGTPYVSIFLSATIAMILALTSAFAYVMTISVLTRLMVYAVTCAALPRLRRKRKGATKFELPYGGFVSAAALLCIVWLTSGGSRHEVRDVLAFAAAGLGAHLAYWFSRRIRKDQTRFEK